VAAARPGADPACRLAGCVLHPTFVAMMRCKKWRITMGPGMLEVGGIPFNPLSLDGSFGGPFGWLLLAFGIFVLGTLAGLMLNSLRERLTQEDVRCPLKGASARVFVRRSGAGRVVGIQSCSLMSPPGEVTCTRPCLAQVHS
jgi:hypothetical protein